MEHSLLEQEIERLKKENERMRNALESIQERTGGIIKRLATNGLIEVR